MTTGLFLRKRTHINDLNEDGCVIQLLNFSNKQQGYCVINADIPIKASYFENAFPGTFSTRQSHVLAQISQFASDLTAILLQFDMNLSVS